MHNITSLQKALGLSAIADAMLCGGCNNAIESVSSSSSVEISQPSEIVSASSQQSLEVGVISTNERFSL